MAPVSMVSVSVRERWSLLAVCLAALALPLSFSAGAIAVPVLAATAQASPGTLAWVTNAFMLSFGSLLLAAGGLADRYGRRRLFLLGTGGFVAATLSVCLAPDLMWLDLARGLQGAAAAAALASGSAALAQAWRGEERACVFALLGTTFGAGLALGPLLTGALLQVLGWRSVFAAGGVLALAAFLLALRVLPESRGESRRLERLAAQHGVTLSSVFGCAFALVLARWSESAEFLLNVPLFDRHADDPRIGEVIADFTNFNIITSDSVQGNLTLRLKDVPWDQALDIILQARGLDMRKNGNVIWIAPRDELAAREKLDLEAKAQIGELEPLRTETFQINYHKAKSVAEFIKGKEQTVLSKRGNVSADERSNKLFVNDVPSRLEDVRRLIAEIDVEVRQVLIEAQIVEATDTFARNLGVRLGFGGKTGGLLGTTTGGVPVYRNTFGTGNLNSTAYQAGQITTMPTFDNSLGVNLPASNINTKQVGALSFALWNSAATRYIDLEVSALEADGRGKVVSRPRVMTADKAEAIIEQGSEIPYQTQTSTTAVATVSFKKANLSLKVKPQITPDGKVMMALDVNKDQPRYDQPVAGGNVPIDTKHVKTDVVVENGGTVVIGGIYIQEVGNNTTKVPLLGDIPVLGYLFRNNERKDNKTELLVFITPRIINDQLGLR